MPRPENTLHNPSSLRALAKGLRAKAKDMEALAAALESAGKGKAVRVAHQVTIDDGLRAIESMRLEVLKKINDGKLMVELQFAGTVP